MEPIFVQWQDASQATVASVFPGPQDAETYPNQGMIQSNDSRYLAWYKSIPVGPSRTGLVVPGS